MKIKVYHILSTVKCEKQRKFAKRDFFLGSKELVSIQPGDVPVTYADTSALESDFGFKPCKSLRDGLRKFAEWYKKFYMYKRGIQK